MTVSLETLEYLYPKDEPAFHRPFCVKTGVDGEVFIYDAKGDVVTVFCRHAQMPINDDRALAAEVSFWTAEGGRLITALNASYPSSPTPAPRAEPGEHQEVLDAIDACNSGEEE